MDAMMAALPRRKRVAKNPKNDVKIPANPQVITQRTSTITAVRAFMFTFQCRNALLH
jgi:hypothetical protein